MKVFLGGVCNGINWREYVIDRLKDYDDIEFYNPLVDNWTEEHRLLEIKARNDSDTIVYVISPEMLGVYSIAEVVDDSNKVPWRTILCILNTCNGIGFSEGMRRSVYAVSEMVRNNGSKIVYSLDDLCTELIRRSNLDNYIEDGSGD